MGYRCGAVLRDGALCRNRVARKRDRCWQHQSMSAADDSSNWWRSLWAAAAIAATVIAVGVYMLDPLSIPQGATSFIIAAAGILGSLVPVLTSFLSKRAERAQRIVYSELTEALGIPPVDQVHTVGADASGIPQTGTGSGVPPEDVPREDGVNGSDRIAEQYHQTVTVNIGSNGALTSLAELERNQSDGNARLVIKYYAQGHRQASVSFILSMVFAVAGFSIAAAAVLSYLINPTNVTGVVVTGTVGAVTELVSILFFRRADRGRDLMMKLVDRLRDDREKEGCFVKTIAMIEQVENPAMKDALRAMAALEFSGSSLTAKELSSVAQSLTNSMQTSAIPQIHIHGPNGKGGPEEKAMRDDRPQSAATAI